MELKKKQLLKELENRKEFCSKAMSNYNKKLPKKLLIALGICLLYASVRMKINANEKISFFTTLFMIYLFFFVIIMINHLRLVKRIKKDINEVDVQIKAFEANT